jgi:hypothetical protein
MKVMKDLCTPEKENMIRRWLKQGPAAGHNVNVSINATVKTGHSSGVKTRKMAAVAEALAAMTKAGSVKPIPTPTLVPAPAPAMAATTDHDLGPVAEVGHMGGVAGQLLAVACESGASGPWCILINGTKAAAGMSMRWAL